MKREIKKNISFEKEYDSLFRHIRTKNALSTDNEWKREGDFFEKFSMYDQKHHTHTSGNTTLIHRE